MVEESGSMHNIQMQSGLLKELTVCKKPCAPSTPQLQHTGRILTQEGTLGEPPRSNKSVESRNSEEDLAKGNPELLPWDPVQTMEINLFENLITETGYHNTAPAGCVVDNNVPCNGIAPTYGEKPEYETDSCSISRVSTCATSYLKTGPSVCVDFYDAQSCNDELVLQTDLSKTEEESINVEAATVEQSLGQEEIKDNGKERTDDSELCGKGSKSETGKKKLKVDWTPDLHRRFVQAVERLGIDQAIPSRILEVMKMEGLTRHNIASHLQKYRSHRKSLPRETEASRRTCPTGWVTHEGSYSLPPRQGNVYIQPWQLILPSAQLHVPSHGQQIAPPLHVWGHPTGDRSHMQMWQQCPTLAVLNTPSTLQALDGSMWQQHVASADAWGYPAPVLETPCYSALKFFAGPVPALSQSSSSSVLHGEDRGSVLLHNDGHPNIVVTPRSAACDKALDFYPKSPVQTRELLDAAISEALSNPDAPLPLGLKPPLMESVMAELEQQGISIAFSCSSP